MTKGNQLEYKKTTNPILEKENKTMTMKEMKKDIINRFKLQFGFAPAYKDIKPLETAGTSGHYEFMAFHVNGIGYIYKANCNIIKNDAYDM